MDKINGFLIGFIIGFICATSIGLLLSMIFNKLGV